MHLPKFIIFGAYKLHKATIKKMLTLHLYVNSCSPEGAINLSTLYDAIAVLLTLNVITLKQCINY